MFTAEYSTQQITQHKCSCVRGGRDCGRGFMCFCWSMLSL